jgi:hypothetical protein
MDITRQPVELGDDQHRLMLPAGIERGGELRTVNLPAALDLRKTFSDKFLMSVKKDTHGLLLGFKSQAAGPWRWVNTR